MPIINNPEQSDLLYTLNKVSKYHVNNVTDFMLIIPGLTFCVETAFYNGILKER